MNGLTWSEQEGVFHCLEKYIASGGEELAKHNLKSCKFISYSSTFRRLEKPSNNEFHVLILTMTKSFGHLNAVEATVRT